MISEIGVALILNCIIIPLAAKNTPMPYIVRKIFLQNLVYIVCCRREEDRSIEREHSMREEKVFNNGYVNSNFNDNITYSKNIRGGRDPEGIPNTDKNPYANLNRQNNDIPNFHTDIIALRERKRFTSTENSEMLKNITDIRDLLHEEVESRKHNGDWEQLTLVLDRIFFIVFVLTIFISVSIILNDAPKITL